MPGEFVGVIKPGLDRFLYGLPPTVATWNGFDAVTQKGYNSIAALSWKTFLEFLHWITHHKVGGAKPDLVTFYKNPETRKIFLPTLSPEDPKWPEQTLWRWLQMESDVNYDGFRPGTMLQVYVAWQKSLLRKSREVNATGDEAGMIAILHGSLGLQGSFAF